MLPDRILDRYTDFNKKWELNKKTGCWNWKEDYRDSYIHEDGFNRPGLPYRIYDSIQSAYDISVIIYRNVIVDLPWYPACGNSQCVNPDHLTFKNGNDFADRMNMLVDNDTVPTLIRMLYDGAKLKLIDKEISLDRSYTHAFNGNKNWTNLIRFEPDKGRKTLRFDLETGRKL